MAIRHGKGLNTVLFGRGTRILFWKNCPLTELHLYKRRTYVEFGDLTANKFCFFGFLFNTSSFHELNILCRRLYDRWSIGCI